MPQMAPLSWLILFIIFTMSFILFTMMNYFNKFFLNNSKITTNKFNQLNLNNKNTWKW
uniref:ATP synthase complex subunit 8 n=1 Tax=Thienemanniella triangula TaxID=3072306 RepID=A0AA51M9E0_9DIPT|nr:ATP synthase F0 subunit 8 [Thienemanniella triangula]WML69333.1 ATP synthase F0 subunit 8 [Thienemanniella triangula]